MISHDLNILVPWIINHGYLIFLVVATIEGPITTIAAGIAAALGYFNIFIIMALAIAADLGGDLIYYSIGHCSHGLVRSRFFRFLGLSESRLEKIERLMHLHTRKAVMLVKFSPFIGPIGLITIGATRPPFKKFLRIALLIAVPKSLFFVLLGYFSGQTYLQLNQVLSDGKYVIIGIVIIIALIYWGYLRIMKGIAKKIENEK